MTQLLEGIGYVTCWVIQINKAMIANTTRITNKTWTTPSSFMACAPRLAPNLDTRSWPLSGSWTARGTTLPPSLGTTARV